MAICGDRNWRSGLLGVFRIIGVLAHVIFYSENHALAQITPDGTLGDRSSRITPNVNIKGLPADRIDGGAIRGANLFHSFQEFNVGELQRVYFANPTGISNILTRVTGSNVSNILGTLGVNGGANLFFLNPNGIIFGKNARLDVAGSFVASTANSFVFGNELEFSATNPQTPSALLTVNPSALFFNQLQPSRIENRSIAPAGITPAGLNAYGLRVGDGKSLLLVGGNVSMDGGNLNAYGGRVEFGGLAAPGNVNLVFNRDNLSLKFPLNVTRADISLTNQAGVHVEGAGGGNIAINARNLEILGGSAFYAGIGGGLGTPETVAGDITLNATGDIKIAGSGSVIGNFVGEEAKGKGGNITIDSGNFSLGDGAQLAASTYGQGNAGNVTVGAKNAVDLADADIFSTVEAGGVGKGGNIDINAATLSLTDGAQLVTATRQASAGIINLANGGNGGSITITGGFAPVIVIKSPIGVGGAISLADATQLGDATQLENAGNVTVAAKDAVPLADEQTSILSTVKAGSVGKGELLTSINNRNRHLQKLSIISYLFNLFHTQPAGRGDAGNINVKVTGVVDIAGEKNGLKSAIISSVKTGTVGNGGNIFIDSGDFSLGDGTQVQASTLGQGNAGNVTVGAKSTVSLVGGSILSTVEAGGVGKGGNLDINATSLSLTDGAQLQASTFGQGNAGNVTVGAKSTVSLVGGSILSTVEAGGVGKGGNLDINATSLSLTDGAQLLTGTRGAFDTQPAGRGDAGNINVKVTGVVDIAGEKNSIASAILSSMETGTVGNVGNIFIDSGNFLLGDGAQLKASTSGVGNAGNVTVGAKNAVSLVGGSILSTVEAGGVGKGGNIDINATSLSLTDGAQLQASTSGVGNAGNVTVGAKNAVDLAGQSTAIFSTVEAGGVGKGGNIDINAANLSLTNGAQLLTITRGASDTQPAGRGDAGNVNVKVTGVVDIAGEKNSFASGILSTVETGTVGNGGNIFIDSGDFSLGDGAQLQASTLGQGNAGNVTVGAKNAVDLADAAIFSTVEAGGVGKGGNIDINAANLSLTNGAQLLTITRGASDTQPAITRGTSDTQPAITRGASDTQPEPAGRGDAGNVNVKVTGVVDISGEKNGFASGILSRVETGTVGNGGNIFIDSGDFSLRDGAQLQALTLGQGNAGNIRVNAKDAVTVSGTSEEIGISSALFTFTDSTSTGIGGDITVNTNIFRLSDGALLDARTRNNQKGGNITVNANVFEALNGGQLTTTTSSNGRAGKITVNATDKLIISGIDPSYNNRITNFPGNILNIGANSGLFVSSTGSGITGDIEINSPQITLDNQGKLNAESASGNGGNINVNSDLLLVNSDLLLLRHGAQISTNAGTAEKGGDGGDININSKFIVAVPKENSDISANAFTGIGGRVDITSDGLFGIVPQKSPTENSDITASSQLGINGTVTISTPDVDPSRGLTQLPSNLVDASQQIAQGCTSRRGKNASHFIATGRGGLPQSPNEPLRGRAVITGWVDLPPQATPRVTDKLAVEITDKKPTTSVTKSTNQIVEAQGWIVDANGDIILVAQSEQSSSIPSAISCSK